MAHDYQVSSQTCQRLCLQIIDLARKQLGCVSAVAIAKHEHEIRALNIALLKDHLRFITDPLDSARSHKTIAHLQLLNQPQSKIIKQG